MKKIISNDKIKHIIISSGIGIFIGIFLPVIVLAQEAYDQVMEQGREDCQKIADQIGEKNPSVVGSGIGTDDFFATCDWDHFGYWRGYTSQMIEDVKITTNAIHFNRYNSAEAAQKDLQSIIQSYSADITNPAETALIFTTKKTSDGFVFVSKTDWVALTGDSKAAKDTSDTSAIVGIIRGSCLMRVSSDTMREPEVAKNYHYIDPKTYKYVDRHPDFNHDREVELLLLARAKAEEILGVLDCGEGTPSTTPPGEDLPEVEALVEKTPTNEDLPMPSKTEEDPENWGEAIVTRMTGGADMQLADGSWQTVEVGTKIPFGAKLFSSYASEVTLEFPNHLVIVVLALSELDIDNPTDYVRKAPRLKLGTGDVRFKVNQGDFRTDMRVDTPNSTASPTGTDFRVSYDKETGRTIWEIYDHSITVTSNSTGETKTISSSYGSPIRRIEVSKDGVMTEQIAIPKDEWQARQGVDTQNQPQESKGNGLFWVFLLILLGGGVFILHKTGKLQPIFEKVLALVRRDNSRPL